MVIRDKIRQKVLKYLPDNYRQIVAQRVGCHPNTVANVLHHGHNNLDVAHALLQLAQEEKEKNAKKASDAKAIAEQL